VERLKTEEKRLYTLVYSVSAENSENQELVSTLRNEVSELRKVAESVRNIPPSVTESPVKISEAHSESDGIPIELISELRSEFPDSDSEFQKILSLDSRKKQDAGTLNDEATELQILEKLL
jgi:hypothetical protein